MGEANSGAYTRPSSQALRIAMIGGTGLAALGGVRETAIEEVGRRLVDRGHAVTVYHRSSAAGNHTPRISDHLGMQVISLGASPLNALAAAAQSAFAGTRFSWMPTPDAAFVFDAAHAPILPVLRLRDVPIVVHVGDAGQIRKGWRQGYRRRAEQLWIRHADALIADTQGTVDYCLAAYALPTEKIGPGTRVLHNLRVDRLAELGLQRNGYHLTVTPVISDSLVDLIVRGYTRSGARLPLAVVGALPESGPQLRRVVKISEDSRVRFLGSLADQDQLDEVYAHAVSYLHGRVDGDDSSLLRAMGACTAAIAWETATARDALGVYGAYFRDPATLAALIEDAELHPHHTREVSLGLQRRAAAFFNWGHVTDSYEDLAQRVVAGHGVRRVLGEPSDRLAWRRARTGRTPTVSDGSV